MNKTLATTTALVGIASMASSTFGVINFDFRYDEESNTTTVTWTGTPDRTSDTTASYSFSNNFTSSTNFTGGDGFMQPFRESMTLITSFPWDISQNWGPIGALDDPISISVGQYFTSVYLPLDITSNVSISGSMSRTGDLVSLGFASNTSDVSGSLGLFPSNDWTYSAGPAPAVPEPQTYALLGGLAIGAACLLRRIRRK